MQYYDIIQTLVTTVLWFFTNPILLTNLSETNAMVSALSLSLADFRAVFRVIVSKTAHERYYET